MGTIYIHVSVGTHHTARNLSFDARRRRTAGLVAHMHPESTYIIVYISLNITLCDDGPTTATRVVCVHT